MRGPTGVYSVSGSAAAIATALDNLVFTPTAHQVAPGKTETTSLAVLVSNSAGTATATTSAVATAANDPPKINGAAANQAAGDTALLKPFAAVSIVEPDVGQTLTATVTPTSAANGTLSNLAGGTCNAATSIYTIAGTVAAVTAALDNLVFTPTAHQVAPGATETTGFTLKVTDTAGASATNTTTSVIAAGSEAVVAASTVSTVTGTQTIAELLDNGTVAIASGASLDVTSAVDPSSSGVFQLETKATLEIAAALGAGSKIQFLGTAPTNRLTLD